MCASVCKRLSVFGKWAWQSMALKVINFKNKSTKIPSELCLLQLAALHISVLLRMQMSCALY